MNARPKCPTGRPCFASAIKVAQLAKAGVLVRPNDDVIQDFNVEQLPGPDQVPGDFDVRIAGRSFAARVVVHNDEGGC